MTSARAASPFAARIRAGARATGVAATFALSAFAGFGTAPTAIRPAQIEADFAPRPYAMAYAVREAVAQRRAERQFSTVVAALDAREASPAAVPVTAYRPDTGTTDTGTTDTLDRFDAFVGGTLALGAAPDAAAPVLVPVPAPVPAPVPVPTMRPVGATASSL